MIRPVRVPWASVAPRLSAVRRLLPMLLAALLLAAPPPAVAAEAAAEDPQQPIRLRVAGGLAELGQYVRHEQPFWSQRVPEMTGGRVRAEIVPFDRSGIR